MCRKGEEEKKKKNLGLPLSSQSVQESPFYTVEKCGGGGGDGRWDRQRHKQTHTLTLQLIDLTGQEAG